MNTKIIMIASALFVSAIGVLLSFLPQEASAYLNIKETNYLFLQLLGALYLGFGVLNWMAKGNVIGGIYSKPVAMANFGHFVVGSLALIKAKAMLGSPVMLYVTVVYCLFALLFFYITFTHPKSN